MTAEESVGPRIAAVLWRLSLLALLAAMAGCTLFNPYNRARELDTTGGDAAGLPASLVGTNPTLQSAINVAAAQRKEYYNAVGIRAEVRNGLPLLLVPLSAAAIYKGIAGTGTEAGRNMVLKEGLAAAAVYGVGNYYTSTTREQIYLSGAQALSCSIYAVTPFFLPDDLASALSAQNLSEIQIRLDDLQRRSDALNQAAAAFLKAYPQFKTAPEALQAATATMAALQSVSNAKTVIKDALTGRDAVADAAAKLRLTVENIVSAVDTQLAKLEPDPSSILAIMGSLIANAQKFSPSGVFTAAGATPPAAEKVALAVGAAAAAVKAAADAAALELGNQTADLAARVEELNKEISQLRIATQAIAQRVNAGSHLAACEVQPVAGRLDVSPADASIDMHVHEIRQFTVRSGAGIPNVDFVGVVATTAGRPISLQKQVAGNTLIVSVTYDSVVNGIGAVALEFSDGTLLDGKKTVTLNLLSDAPGAAPEQAGKPPVQNPPVKKPPKAVEQKNPGENPPPSQGQVTPGVADTTVVPTPDTPALAGSGDGAMNPLEKAMSSADRKVLQKQLKVELTGVFDPATRAAIQNWQQAHQWQGPHDGLLTPALVQAINTP
jgi:peptidoglycan hydrolase-like protein with peptidoglycan-binding domain